MTSRKQQVEELWTLVQADDTTPAQAKAALDEMLELKQATRVSWGKLGVSDEAYQTFVDETEADLALEADKPAPKKKKAKAKEPDDTRGLITDLVRGLLADTDLPYHAIVQRVVEAHPDAKTTNRSVASVAAQMRREHKADPSKPVVAMRRAKKGDAS